MSTTNTPTPPLQSAPPPVVSQKQSSESFFEHVKSFFVKVAVFVSKTFEEIFGTQASQQFAQGAEALLNTALGKIALDAVTSAASLANNSQKFSTAASQIASTAKAQGIQVADSLINMLIELCVQKVKGSFGPVAS